MQSIKEILTHSFHATYHPHHDIGSKYMLNTKINPQQQYSVSSSSRNEDNILNKESQQLNNIIWSRPNSTSSHDKSSSTPKTSINDEEPLFKVELFLAIF